MGFFSKGGAALDRLFFFIHKKSKAKLNRLYHHLKKHYVAYALFGSVLLIPEFQTASFLKAGGTLWDSSTKKADYSDRYIVIENDDSRFGKKISVHYREPLTFIGRTSSGKTYISTVENATDKVYDDEPVYAGRKETSTDLRYDSDGWPLRGWLSFGEWKGKHLDSIGVAREVFVARKREVINQFFMRIEEHYDAIKASQKDKYSNGKENFYMQIPPFEVVKAQSMLESMAGTSYVSWMSGNYYGMKYGDNWATRDGVLGPTGEVCDDTCKDRFIRFGIIEEGKEIVSEWWGMYYYLRNVARYAKATGVSSSSSIKEWCDAFCALRNHSVFHNYATSCNNNPSYSDKLYNTVNLYR